MVRLATTVVGFACIALFGAIDARAAGLSLALAPSDYIVTDPYSYDASRPYAAGWNRGADVVPAGGVVRALTNGRVAFSGTVAGRRVLTVRSTIDGTPVIVTYTGMRDGTLDVGDAVGSRDVIGSAHALHVGAYVAGDHHRYVPITTDHVTATPANEARGGRARAVLHGPSPHESSARSPTADAIADRLHDAIAGAAHAVRIAPLARGDGVRAPVVRGPSNRGMAGTHAATRFVRSRAMLRTQLARAWPEAIGAAMQLGASNASARRNSVRDASEYATDIAHASLASGRVAMEVTSGRPMHATPLRHSDVDDPGQPATGRASGAHVAGGTPGAGLHALPEHGGGLGRLTTHRRSTSSATLAIEHVRHATRHAARAADVESVGPRRAATSRTGHGDRGAWSATIVVLLTCVVAVGAWLSHRRVRRRRGGRRRSVPAVIHHWRLPIPHPSISARSLLQRRSRGGGAQRVRLPNTHGPAMRQLRRRPREPA